MKRHWILPLLGLAALWATAAAAETVYAPSLPTVPVVPMIVHIPNLPSRIDMIIPGQTPTRNLPGRITQVPAARLPAAAIPGRPERVSLPPAAFRTVRMTLASRAKAPSAHALDRAFDNSRSQEPALSEDEAVYVPSPKGDSSHLTLPESDLESEIGIR